MSGLIFLCGVCVVVFMCVICGVLCFNSVWRFMVLCFCGVCVVVCLFWICGVVFICGIL